MTLLPETVDANDDDRRDKAEYKLLHFIHSFFPDRVRERNNKLLGLSAASTNSPVNRMSTVMFENDHFDANSGIIDSWENYLSG